LLLFTAVQVVHFNRHALVWNDLNLARIAALPANTPYVVILGSSKVGCAVAFDDQMESLLKAHGKQISVVKLGKTESEFKDFSAAFDAMARHPPKLVLLDMDFFIYEPKIYRERGQSTSVGWREATRVGLPALLNIHLTPAGERYEFNHPQSGSLPCPRRPWGNNLERRTYAATLRNRRVSTPAERQAILERVRGLRAAGATVALISTPRSPDAKDLFPGHLEREGREILNASAAANGLTVLDSPPVLPAEYFFDPGHVDGRGRAAYSQWLAARIAEILDRPAHA
jgi:hypothetical protein